MKHIKISIIGCSVAIRIRPPQKEPNNKNYGQFLLSKLSEKNENVYFTINNKAFTRAILKDIFLKIDELISDYPDYFILNIGIPDASTREIPLYISNFITYKNHLKFSVFIQLIYNFLIKPNIKFFVKIRGKRTWVNKKQFKNLYEKTINYIIKETNAKIIIIPINPPSKRIEDKLPGTIKNVVIYNKIISDLAEKYNINMVNINDLEPTQNFPDGIHYSVDGHKEISNRISEFINL